MKNCRHILAGFIAGAALVLAAVPAVAASVDVNVMLPGAVVQPVYQPRPEYVHPRYESDWRERQARAQAWQSNPQNHGQQVSAAAHARNEDRAFHKGHGKKHKKDKRNKHNKHNKHGK
ncbi:MAG: hypothetical protein JWP36_394 [Paucimonas sp.]|nr:hypothetical protein [Paucimonas sp.]